METYWVMVNDHAVQQRADGVEAAHVQTCGPENTIKAQTKTSPRQQILRCFKVTVQTNDPNQAGFLNRELRIIL